MNDQKLEILEGSRAIALTIKNIGPGVVSAYPITPQTHIVEDLAKFKADGFGNYEYVRAESEFAAASIIAGASAAGARVYSATSSQGLLLMTEVIYNIAGMRLPVVMTCANRAVSAPINIWNDQQDVMAVRDSGWIMFFAENSQESVDQHVMAFKIAEKLNLPVMLNLDGFVLTHVYEPVKIPDEKLLKKYLPEYKPKSGQYLDPKNPVTMGAFASPENYMEIREELQNDLLSSLETIKDEYNNYNRLVRNSNPSSNDLAFAEYYGPRNPKILLIAMGSVIGTMKDVVDEHNSSFFNDKVGMLKIKVFRPFPSEEILKYLKSSKYIAVIDKSISLGQLGPLASDIKAAAQGKINAEIKSYILGLGGRDITKKMIKEVILDCKKKSQNAIFIGK